VERPDFYARQGRADVTARPKRPKRRGVSADEYVGRIHSASLRDFGKPDVPPAVAVAAKNKAQLLRMTPRQALDRMLKKAGGMEALVEGLKKTAKKTRKTTAPANGFFGATHPKRLRVLPGGAVGLGGVRKPMRVGGK
jgi:hypothetical protein